MFRWFFCYHFAPDGSTSDANIIKKQPDLYANGARIIKKIFMDKQLLEDIIRGLTLVQIQLENQRRDHNGQVLKHDDIDQLSETIKILLALEIDHKIIWQKK